MTNTILLDHMVINVRFDIDGAAEQFAKIGFQLTERGYHSLGSMNHLMIFGSDYLELLGLPEGVTGVRPEISEAPVGLNGLVFKSSDVDRTFEHLRTLGLDGDPPRAFSRPVTVSGEEHQARFRTVAVRAGVFAAGRVYFCEHATPQLVWRDEWRVHGNAADATYEFVIVAAEPEAEVRRYAALIERDPEVLDNHVASIDLSGSQLTVLSPSRYRERFGALAIDPDGRASIFGALSLRTTDLAGAKALADAAGFAAAGDAERVQVLVTGFATLLEFRA